jgi:hypothetical protein
MSIFVLVLSLGMTEIGAIWEAGNELPLFMLSLQLCMLVYWSWLCTCLTQNVN